MKCGSPVERSELDRGLPEGLASATAALGRSASSVLSRLDGVAIGVDELALLGLVRYPDLVLDATTEPRIVQVGGGHVHADHGDADEQTFQELLQRFGNDAESLASIAQECRLPVTPYRADARPVVERASSGESRSLDGTGTRGLQGLVVVDLSSLWAGPMCTRLLEHCGARVHRVESSSRPDGLRRSPQLFAHLRGDACFLDLDLRVDQDRLTFEHIVARADVLVESFTPRVMPNLGYPWQHLRKLMRPSACLVSIRAFPEGSRCANWAAYGGGVHAMSGLGVSDGSPRPARFSYLDPVTGLNAFLAVLRALARPTASVRRIEVSLAGTANWLRSRGVRPVSNSEQPSPDVLSLLGERLHATMAQPFRVLSRGQR